MKDNSIQKVESLHNIYSAQFFVVFFFTFLFCFFVFRTAIQNDNMAARAGRDYDCDSLQFGSYKAYRMAAGISQLIIRETAKLNEFENREYNRQEREKTAKLACDYKKQKQKEAEDTLTLEAQTGVNDLCDADFQSSRSGIGGDFLLCRRSRDFGKWNQQRAMEPITTAVNDIYGGVVGDFANVSAPGTVQLTTQPDGMTRIPDNMSLTGAAGGDRTGVPQQGQAHEKTSSNLGTVAEDAAELTRLVQHVVNEIEESNTNIALNLQHGKRAVFEDDFRRAGYLQNAGDAVSGAARGHGLARCESVDSVINMDDRDTTADIEASPPADEKKAGDKKKDDEKKSDESTKRYADMTAEGCLKRKQERRSENLQSVNPRGFVNRYKHGLSSDLVPGAMADGLMSDDVKEHGKEQAVRDLESRTTYNYEKMIENVESFDASKHSKRNRTHRKIFNKFGERDEERGKTFEKNKKEQEKQRAKEADDILQEIEEDNVEFEIDSKKIQYILRDFSEFGQILSFSRDVIGDIDALAKLFVSRNGASTDMNIDFQRFHKWLQLNGLDGLRLIKDILEGEWERFEQEMIKGKVPLECIEAVRNCFYRQDFLMDGVCVVCGLKSGIDRYIRMLQHANEINADETSLFGDYVKEKLIAKKGSYQLSDERIDLIVTTLKKNWINAATLESFGGNGVTIYETLSSTLPDQFAGNEDMLEDVPRLAKILVEQLCMITKTDISHHDDPFDLDTFETPEKLYEAIFESLLENRRYEYSMAADTVFVHGNLSNARDLVHELPAEKTRFISQVFTLYGEKGLTFKVQRRGRGLASEPSSCNYAGALKKDVAQNIQRTQNQHGQSYEELRRKKHELIRWIAERDLYTREKKELELLVVYTHGKKAHHLRNIHSTYGYQMGVLSCLCDTQRACNEERSNLMESKYDLNALISSLSHKINREIVGAPMDSQNRVSELEHVKKNSSTNRVSAIVAYYEKERTMFEERLQLSSSKIDTFNAVKLKWQLLLDIARKGWKHGVQTLTKCYGLRKQSGTNELNPSYTQRVAERLMEEQGRIVDLLIYGTEYDGTNSSVMSTIRDDINKVAEENLETFDALVDKVALAKFLSEAWLEDKRSTNNEIIDELLQMLPNFTVPANDEDAYKIINGTSEDDLERRLKGDIHRPQFRAQLCSNTQGSNAKKYGPHKLAQLGMLDNTDEKTNGSGRNDGGLGKWRRDVDLKAEWRSISHLSSDKRKECMKKVLLQSIDPEWNINSLSEKFTRDFNQQLQDHEDKVRGLIGSGCELDDHSDDNDNDRYNRPLAHKYDSTANMGANGHGTNGNDARNGNVTRISDLLFGNSVNGHGTGARDEMAIGDVGNQSVTSQDPNTPQPALSNGQFSTLSGG